MGIIETLVHGSLSLVETYYEGKSFFDVETGEPAATKAYLAKSLEEILRDKMDGKPIGGEVVGKGINALVDYKVTEGLYSYLTSVDPDNPGESSFFAEHKMLASMVSKAVGLVASSIAGSLAKGIADHLFGTGDTGDYADRQLREHNRYNDFNSPGMLAKFEDLLGFGGDAPEVSAPLQGGGYRGANAPHQV